MSERGFLIALRGDCGLQKPRRLLLKAQAPLSARSSASQTETGESQSSFRAEAISREARRPSFRSEVRLQIQTCVSRSSFTSEALPTPPAAERVKRCRPESRSAPCTPRGDVSSRPARRHHARDGLAEASHGDGPARAPHVFEDGETGGLEFGDREGRLSGHAEIVPWSTTMVTARSRRCSPTSCGC